MNRVQAAAELGIAPQTLSEKLARGLILGARKIGRQWFIAVPVRERERPAGRGPESRWTLARRQEREEAERTIASAFGVVKLYTSPICELAAHIPASSIDSIITDPPYPKAFLDLYSDLAKFAAHALKPGGSLLVMVGQSFLPEVMARLNEDLRYHWTIAYLTPGGQAVQLWDREVNTFWKPVLWYVKGEYAGRWVGDVVKSAVNDNDKRFHQWGQSESGIADIVQRFTGVGDTVCDPFVGGGTVAVVSLRMGRYFIGGDVDAEAIATTRRRIAESCPGKDALARSCSE